MKLDHLFEDANNDISTLRWAEGLTNRFLQWLSKANEEQPIKDCMMIWNRPTEVWATVKANEFRGPHNLYVGFFWKKDGQLTAKAVMRSGTVEGKPVNFVLYGMDYDISDQTDVAFSLKHDLFVHEIVHHLDDQREQVKQVPVGSENHERYFNSPTEFNAYFIQGLHFILKDVEEYGLEHADSFGAFKRQALFRFDYGFREHLTGKMKRKFEVRLYKLYQYLTTHPKPIEKEAVQASGD